MKKTWIQAVKTTSSATYFLLNGKHTLQSVCILLQTFEENRRCCLWTLSLLLCTLHSGIILFIGLIRSSTTPLRIWFRAKSCKLKLQNTQARSPHKKHFSGQHYQKNGSFPALHFCAASPSWWQVTEIKIIRMWTCPERQACKQNYKMNSGLDTFTIPFKAVFYFTMHGHVRWHCQLLRVTLLQASKEKSKEPHEGKAMSLNKASKTLYLIPQINRCFYCQCFHFMFPSWKWQGKSAPAW